MLEHFLQLILAAVLGGLVGMEREHKRKEAGLRTYAMISLGSALFAIVAFANTDSGDPIRVVQAVAPGIGFIGAGVIIYRQFRVEGLTTAAGLWVTAGIGLAVGVGLYWTAIFVSFLMILILEGLRLIEERLFKSKPLA